VSGAGRPPARRRAPWPRRNSAAEIAARQAILRAQPGWDAAHDFVWDWPRPPAELAGLQEALTAHMVLPVGVAGPIAVDLGRYETDPASGRLAETGRRREEVYVPLAHTEGGLTASLLRGAAAVARDGGVRTHVLRDRMTRASCFVFDTAAAALRLAAWISGQAGAMRAWLEDPANPLRGEALGGVPRLSRHARLWEVDSHVVGPACHVLYRYTTGEACGPNMITRNSYALNQEFVLRRFPPHSGVAPRRVYLEANMGGDKKPSALYFGAGGHGKTVLAEATLSESTLRRILRVTREDLIALEHTGMHGGHASGMQSVAATPASAVAAVFAATGQDLGMIGTSSMAQLVLEPVAGGVHFSLRFSGLEVGTVGGGTGSPHARAFLSLLGCQGPGSALRLAQIVAAAALCLDLSASAAMAAAGSENFAQTHQQHSGRGTPAPADPA
jgi:hydroxymethylglutaryl-CoA reductase (NADPH)